VVDVDWWEASGGGPEETGGSFGGTVPRCCRGGRSGRAEAAVAGAVRAAAKP
jgi:hypothetical protein